MLETLPQDIGPKQFNEMLDDFQCRAVELSDHSLHHLTHFDSVAANLEPSGTFKTLATYLFKIAIAIHILSCEFSLVSIPPTPQLWTPKNTHGINNTWLFPAGDSTVRYQNYAEIILQNFTS